MVCDIKCSPHRDPHSELCVFLLRACRAVRELASVSPRGDRCNEMGYRACMASWCLSPTSVAPSSVSLQSGDHGRPTGDGRPMGDHGRPTGDQGRPRETNGRPREINGRPREINGRPRETNGRSLGRPRETTGDHHTGIHTVSGGDSGGDSPSLRVGSKGVSSGVEGIVEEIALH